MSSLRPALGIVTALGVLGASLGLGAQAWSVVKAHDPGNIHGNDIEFGTRRADVQDPLVDDADTVRKVTPRSLTIQAGQSVTFHVNGGHQVLVLKPGVDIVDLGSEGINLDGTGPQTPLPPEVYSAAFAPAGLGPVQGPGFWDANSAGTDPLRAQVYFKQAVPTSALNFDHIEVTFESPGRYVFICNFTAHFVDEGIEVTGPNNPDAPIIVNGFGMHGRIIVE